MKKLFKEINKLEIHHHLFGLLIAISKRSMPMSYYSEKMMIPKSNLTVMADKLIENELIERIHDENDRRVIVLHITSKGSKWLDDSFSMLREDMVKKSRSLSDQEVTRLNELIEEMNSIFQKIHNN
jgi:DNA-binding MarR family transcriptional regulator